MPESQISFVNVTGVPDSSRVCNYAGDTGCKWSMRLAKKRIAVIVVWALQE
jgi:hypothetical protein